MRINLWPFPGGKRRWKRQRNSAEAKIFQRSRHENRKEAWPCRGRKGDSYNYYCEARLFSDRRTKTKSDSLFLAGVLRSCLTVPESNLMLHDSALSLTLLLLPSQSCNLIVDHSSCLHTFYLSTKQKRCTFYFTEKQKPGRSREIKNSSLSVACPCAENAQSPSRI